MLRKNIFGFVALLLSLTTLVAQEAKGGIEFFKGTLEAAREKAGKENKVVFVDFYATWCVPCKKMEKTIFTDPKVGEYFNQKFINLQLDAELPEHIAAAKQYKVEAFPTMVFIAPDGKMLSILTGYHDAEQLLKGAKTAIGDIIGIPQLYESYRKDKNNLSIQQQILLAAPQFLMAQEGVEADKWAVRLSKLYKSYIQAKKGPSLINENDYIIITTLGGDDAELKEELVAFVSQNLSAWRDSVGPAAAYYVVMHNDEEMENLAKAGKTSYLDRLEKIKGEYADAYSVTPKTNLSPYDKSKITINALYKLYKEKDTKSYVAMMQDYFKQMGTGATANEYAKAAQELYGAVGDKLTSDAHQQAIKWLGYALQGDNNVMDRVNYITMIGDSHKALKEYDKAQAQYNQAYAESLQLSDMEMVQAMIQQKLTMRLAELELLRR